MVASSSTRSAFNTVDSVSVNGDSRRVCPYPANQPSHIRTWEEHFKAHLDAKDILEPLTMPDMDQVTWLAANVSPADLAMLTKIEQADKYAIEFCEPRRLASRSAYNILVTWPGVLDSGMHERIQSEGLDKTRDGRKLLAILLAPGDLKAERVQIALQEQIAIVHGMAYDPSSTLPFTSEKPPQVEVLSFLELYWTAVHNTSADGIDTNPAIFVKTSLLVLRRIPELWVAAEWLKQVCETHGYPARGRAFIAAMKQRMLSTSLPTESHHIDFNLSTANTPPSPSLFAFGPPRPAPKGGPGGTRPPYQRQTGSRPTGAGGRPVPQPSTCDHCDARGCTGRPGRPVTECASCCPDDKAYTRFIKSNASESEKKHILLGRKAMATKKRKDLKGVHPRELLATIFAAFCDPALIDAQLAQRSEEEGSFENVPEDEFDTHDLIGSMNALISEVTGLELGGDDLSELGIDRATLGVFAGASGAASARVARAAERLNSSPGQSVVLAPVPSPLLAAPDADPDEPAPAWLDAAARHVESLPPVSDDAHADVSASGSAYAFVFESPSGFESAVPSGASSSVVPTADELGISLALHRALYSIVPPGSLPLDLSQVELRKPPGSMHRVTFPILVHVHGQAAAAHMWFASTPTGSYSAAEAAELLDPGTVELFAPSFVGLTSRLQERVPTLPSSSTDSLHRTEPAWRTEAIEGLKAFRARLAHSREILQTERASPSGSAPSPEAQAKAAKAVKAAYHQHERAKRAVAKKAAASFASEPADDDDDGPVLEENDAFSAAPSTPSASAATTDSGSGSQRDSSSDSGSALSSVGADGKASDLAYASALPTYISIGPLISHLHELGIYGQLRQFVELHLLSVDVVVNLTDDHINGICAASTAAGPSPEASRILSVAQSIRHIQRAALTDPVQADLGGVLRAVSLSASASGLSSAGGVSVPCDGSSPVVPSAHDVASLARSDKLRQDNAHAVIRSAIHSRRLRRFARTSSAARAAGKLVLAAASSKVSSAHAAHLLAMQAHVRSMQALDDAEADQVFAQKRADSDIARSRVASAVADAEYLARVKERSTMRIDEERLVALPAGSPISAALESPGDASCGSEISASPSASESDSDVSHISGLSAPPFVPLQKGSAECPYCNAIGILHERCSACTKIIVERRLRQSTVSVQHVRNTAGQPPDLRNTQSLASEASSGSGTVASDSSSGQSATSLSVVECSGCVEPGCAPGCACAPSHVFSTPSVTVSADGPVLEMHSETRKDSDASVISITKASSRDKLGVYFAYSKGDGLTVSKLRENVSRYLVGKFHVGQQIVSVDGTCYANPAELVKYVNSCPAGVAINFCVKPLQGKA